MSLSANALFRLGRREGVLCIPDGGVLTTGSGCSGVGGSSGSGTTTSGNTPRDAPGSVRPDIAFSNSSSTSGAGGGSGLGVGLVGVLAGPSRLAGDRRTLSPSDPARAPPSRMPERSSICVLIARVKLPVLSGVAAREAERGASGEDRSRLGWLSLRLRISGLYRSILARVGDAKEGRLGDDPVGGRASCGVVDSGSGCTATATAVRGDVLRLLGAEVSIAAQLGFSLYGHSHRQFRREISANDASKWALGLVVSCFLRRIVGIGVLFGSRISRVSGEQCGCARITPCPTHGIGCLPKTRHCAPKRSSNQTTTFSMHQLGYTAPGPFIFAFANVVRERDCIHDPNPSFTTPRRLLPLSQPIPSYTSTQSRPK